MGGEVSFPMGIIHVAVLGFLFALSPTAAFSFNVSFVES